MPYPRDARPAHRRAQLSWGALGFFVALLLILAALQYRWTGDVSQAERTRLHEQLQETQKDFHLTPERICAAIKTGLALEKRPPLKPVELQDAPSGTASTLAEILAEVRQQLLSKVIRHGRHGVTGERTAAEIGMHSLRGGDVVGDHTVIFAATGERLELTHKASSRGTFANGALRAAQWVVKQKPGIYDMQDVLGLK